MAHDPTISDEMRQALEETSTAMGRHQASYALIGGMLAYRHKCR
jgi:hypothetical protein